MRMDFKLEVITGGGKKANRESKSITLKEVQTKEQVITAIGEHFSQYFANIQPLTETKPRNKKNTT